MLSYYMTVHMLSFFLGSIVFTVVIVVVSYKNILIFTYAPIPYYFEILVAG